MLDTIEQGEGCAHPRSSVDLRFARRLRESRGDEDERGRRWSFQAVENTGPKNGLYLCHLVPYDEDATGIFDVSVEARLAIGTRRISYSSCRRCRAEPCVPIPSQAEMPCLRAKHDHCVPGGKAYM